MGSRLCILPYRFPAPGAPLTAAAADQATRASHNTRQGPARHDAGIATLP